MLRCVALSRCSLLTRRKLQPQPPPSLRCSRFLFLSLALFSILLLLSLSIRSPFPLASPHSPHCTQLQLADSSAPGHEQVRQTEWQSCSAALPSHQSPARLTLPDPTLPQATTPTLTSQLTPPLQGESCEEAAGGLSGNGGCSCGGRACAVVRLDWAFALAVSSRCAHTTHVRGEGERERCKA